MDAPVFPPSPRFPAMLRPTSDFQAVRDGRSTGPLYIDISLGTARSVANGTALELNIAGNFLYVDQRQNSGSATLYLESDDRGITPLSIFPGWKAQVPFTRIFIENTLQGGQTLRLVYGTDLDLDPGSGAGVSVLNAITVQDQIAPNAQHFYLSTTVPVGNNRNDFAVGGPLYRVRNVTLSGAAGAGGSITLAIIAYEFGGGFAGSFASATNMAVLGSLVNYGTTVQQLNVSLNRQIPRLWWIAAFYSATVAVGSAEFAVTYENAG